MGEHSHGPWRARLFGGKWCVLHKGGDDTTILAECGTQADAEIMAAALDLLEAAQLLEAAELGRQECEDEGEPEACGTCFPLFDDARVKRRIAIAKATSP